MQNPSVPVPVPASAAVSTPAPARRIADLPGPRGLPLLGNLLQIRLPRLHLDLERWARRYGPCYRIRLGRTPVLVVADHDAIALILRDRPDGFRRARATAAVSRELGVAPGVFLAEGAQWRNQRRMVMSGFTPNAVKAYFPALLKTALRLQRRWDGAAAAGLGIDLNADLKRYTVDLIAGLAFGSDVNTIETGDDAIQGHLDEILAGVARRSFMPFPYWRYFKLPVDRRLERSAAAMRAAVDDFVAQARVRLAADAALRARPANLIEAMLVAADQPDSGVDHAGVAGNVTTMLLAGEDTTANTLCWLISLLQRHPDALQRAQREVLELAPDAANFSVEQMDALTYLDACTQEAMRLKPVAPLIPFEALRDTRVADVEVPAGTHLLCLLRHHRLDDSHAADAGFEPQRWLAADTAHAGDHKRTSIPFGAGPRMCPGRYLALLEIKIAMAMLLGRFDIVAVDAAGGAEPREVQGFVMAPESLRMRLAPRRAAAAAAG